MSVGVLLNALRKIVEKTTDPCANRIAKRALSRYEQYEKEDRKTNSHRLVIELIYDPDDQTANPQQDAWFVHVPQLPGLMSQGATVKEALRMIQDAAHGWLDAADEDISALLRKDPAASLWYRELNQEKGKIVWLSDSNDGEKGGLS